MRSLVCQNYKPIRTYIRPCTIAISISIQTLVLIVVLSLSLSLSLSLVFPIFFYTTRRCTSFRFVAFYLFRRLVASGPKGTSKDDSTFDYTPTANGEYTGELVNIHLIFIFLFFLFFFYIFLICLLEQDRKL